MFWIFASLVFIVDRFVKNMVAAHLVLHEEHSLIDGIVSLLYVQNQGAAFSMLSGQRWLLLVIAAITICGILWYRHRYPLQPQLDMALGCIVGGALGNMYDRFHLGYVIDYISIGWWPVFNVADIAIVCGGVWLFLSILFSNKAGE